MRSSDYTVRVACLVSVCAALAALFLEYLLAECWLGPTVASLQAAAPPSAQGLTTGVFSCLTLVGNLAPFLIGIACVVTPSSKSREHECYCS